MDGDDRRDLVVGVPVERQAQQLVEEEPQDAAELGGGDARQDVVGRRARLLRERPGQCPLAVVVELA
ncbi:hypothetical protein ACGF7U_13725 [Micromonospora sp. NPDC047670]|uniref:hypothetical protein n=1 Tax=Micromonospora sp. NPDC047670 TaxID=3364252 RepID=UPI00371062F7